MIVGLSGSEMAQLALGAWELHIIAESVADAVARHGDSPFAEALALKLQVAADALPIGPCLCGELHPEEDCARAGADTD